MYGLIKSVHFVQLRANYNLKKLAKIYIRKIVRVYGLPMSIISDRGLQFTLSFWSTMQYELGTTLKLITTIHPQMYG